MSRRKSSTPGASRRKKGQTKTICTCEKLNRMKIRPRPVNTGAENRVLVPDETIRMEEDPFSTLYPVPDDES